jgi:DNA-binding MarR family transcriptional regulator
VSEIVEAIDRQIEVAEREFDTARRRLDELVELRNRAEALDRSPVKEPPPKPARKRRTPKKRTAATVTEAERATRNEAIKGQREKVLAFVRANPGATGNEVASGTGIDQGAVSRHLHALLRNGDIRREQDGASKRNYPSQHDALSADESGAKTGPERRIIEAIKAAPSPPTAAEIGKAAKLNGTVNEMLGALERRGVVRRLPGETPQSAARWELAA